MFSWQVATSNISIFNFFIWSEPLSDLLRCIMIWYDMMCTGRSCKPMHVCPDHLQLPFLLEIQHLALTELQSLLKLIFNSCSSMAVSDLLSKTAGVGASTTSTDNPIHWLATWLLTDEDSDYLCLDCYVSVFACI